MALYDNYLDSMTATWTLSQLLRFYDRAMMCCVNEAIELSLTYSFVQQRRKQTFPHKQLPGEFIGSCLLDRHKCLRLIQEHDQLRVDRNRSRLNDAYDG